MFIASLTLCVSVIVSLAPGGCGLSPFPQMNISPLPNIPNFNPFGNDFLNSIDSERDDALKDLNNKGISMDTLKHIAKLENVAGVVGTTTNSGKVAADYSKTPKADDDIKFNDPDFEEFDD